ncbi:MAG: DNA-directed RNA polymerase subunit N [archaeon]|nr:DNA-directed RNA polymerase subunit N [archaeon]
MMVPIRCFTCGKVIGSDYVEYEKRVSMGEDAQKVLDSLGIERYCCRRMFISHADLIKDIAPLG